MQLHGFSEEDAIILKPLIISSPKNKEFLPLENEFVKWKKKKKSAAMCICA